MNHAGHLLKSLFIMASMVEARDPYTGGHLWRVSQFSRILAEDGELPTNMVARISLGGFLHDLGKISVPDAILNKPDKLTNDEYEIIKTHTEVGSRLLADHPLADLANSAVLSHHETPDGRGYPHGLSGEEISVDASIVGICDAFDAMTSTRPYRKGMPIDRALGIIQENLGRQFHADWGSRFVRLGQSGSLDHIVGHTEPGIPLQECPMCGPTIVVTRHKRNGDHVYCRSCGGGAIVNREHGKTTIKPTMKRGKVRDLEPEIDNDLLNELVLVSSLQLDLSIMR